MRDACACFARRNRVHRARTADEHHRPGQHILDLRGGLDLALSTLLLDALSYTDPTITPGSTTIKAAHLTEIRNGVK